MAKIKIQNVGPIKEGYTENDGFLDLKKISIFIGPQGAGKSTVAKIISTFCWIEKALIRKEFTDKQLKQKQKEIISYQGLEKENYLMNEKSLVIYEGLYYSITFIEKQLSAVEKKIENYKIPKIMYVPAERNFISVVNNPEKLKYLPQPLVTFLDEYTNACDKVDKNGLILPIDNVQFKYDKSNKIAKIKGSDYEIRLSWASSGFQSVVPLFVVTQYLSKSIDEEASLSNKQMQQLDEEIKKIVEDKNLDDLAKKTLLNQAAYKYKNAFLLNIVEEPEQNLYPSSQKEILYKLIEFANQNEHNKLIITTHSQYLIGYLSLCIEAKNIAENYPNAKSEISQFVPATSVVDANEVVVYQIRNGQIQTLNLDDLDDNYLNEHLAATNDDFYELTKIKLKHKNGIY